MLLEAGCSRDEFLWRTRAECLNGGTQTVVGVERARLVQLALGCQAGDIGPWAGAVREGSLAEDTRRGKLGWVWGGRAEGIPEGEEAVPSQPGIAGGSGWCASRAKLEEIEIVVVDQKGNGDEDDQELEHQAVHKIHANDQHHGDGKESRCVERDIEGVLADDHINSDPFGLFALRGLLRLSRHSERHRGGCE